MKKVVFCIAVVLTVFSVSCFAQPGGGGERMKQIMKDSLRFSDVQVDSVMAVRQQFTPQMRDIFMDQSFTPEEKRAKLAALTVQVRARYKAFLSDDQIAKLEAIQQRMRGQMRRGGGGGNQ